MRTDADILAAEEKMRIAVASHVASGMLANPEIFVQRDYRNVVAFEAVNIADKIIAMVRGAA